MTYQDFLDSLVSPITSFVSWLSMVANSLIHNYIFITMLGIVLFISLVWLVYDIIDWFFYSHINDYDDFNNRLYDYGVFKKVQYEYLNKNYDKEFEYKYKLRVLNEQVFSSLLHNNRDLLLQNTKSNMYLRHNAFFGSDVYFDESSPAFLNKEDNNYLSDHYNEVFKEYEIGRKARQFVINHYAGIVGADLVKKEEEQKKKDEIARRINSQGKITQKDIDEIEDILDNF